MISPAWFLSVLLFGISMTGTPGPNNVMLTASGARYGYWRTLPHILGILAGSVVLFTVLALGLGVVFERHPLVHRILQLLGGAYLLYLAGRIASAPPPSLHDRSDARPLGFWQAAAFQFANPKIWVMGLTLMASFLPRDGWLPVNAIGLAMLMELIAFPCISCWALFGRSIGRRLTSDRAWRRFNGVMGALTAACVLLLFIE